MLKSISLETWNEPIQNSHLHNSSRTKGWNPLQLCADVCLDSGSGSNGLRKQCRESGGPRERGGAKQMSACRVPWRAEWAPNPLQRMNNVRLLPLRTSFDSAVAGGLLHAHTKGMSRTRAALNPKIRIRDSEFTVKIGIGSRPSGPEVPTLI